MTDDPPEGYVDPTPVYLVEFADDAPGQLAGFTTMEAATSLIDQLDAEGRHGPLHINIVAIHTRVEDWNYDR